MPGLSAGLFRLVWMTLPADPGHTRKMVPLTSLPLIASTLGWGVIHPTAPYWGADGAGLPRRHRRRRLLRVLCRAHPALLPVGGKRGTRWGSRPGLATSVSPQLQLLTPYLAVSFFAFLGDSQQMRSRAKPSKEVWSKRRLRWIPLMVIGAIARWTLLKSVPVKANIRPAVRHLQQHRHLADDAPLHHDLRYLLRTGRSVRTADNRTSTAPAAVTSSAGGASAKVLII